LKNTSVYWIGIVCLAAAAAALYGIFAAQGFALRGLAWVTLGLAAVTFAVAARKTPRSLGDVLYDVDHEPKAAPAYAPGSESSRKERGTP
jgi:hypothetical protein